MFDPANATATMTASTRVLAGNAFAMGFPLLPPSKDPTDYSREASGRQPGDRPDNGNHLPLWITGWLWTTRLDRSCERRTSQRPRIGWIPGVGGRPSVRA